MNKLKYSLEIIILLIIVGFIVNLNQHSSSIEKKQPRQFNLSSTTTSDIPLFIPNTLACTHLDKISTTVNKDGLQSQWQTSMPRSEIAKIYPGDIVKLGLRNKMGTKDDTFFYTIRVQAPDGTATSADNSTNADSWSDTMYPKDFPGAERTKKGTYSILYQIQGKAIVCDGFVVSD